MKEGRFHHQPAGFLKKVGITSQRGDVAKAVWEKTSHSPGCCRGW